MTLLAHDALNEVRNVTTDQLQVISWVKNSPQQRRQTYKLQHLRFAAVCLRTGQLPSNLLKKKRMMAKKMLKTAQAFWVPCTAQRRQEEGCGKEECS